MNTSTSLLDAERLLRASEFATATWGLAGAGLRDRLGQLVEAVQGSGRLNEANAAQAHNQLQMLLHRRLRMEADIQRAPAILEERIERPVFVIGYARTGTTLLHALLAQDPASRAPTWWQTHEPSPPPGEVAPTPFRLERARHQMHSLLDAMPGLLAMHPYYDEGEHMLSEDEEIFSLDLHGTYPTMLYKVPGLDSMQTGADAAGSYRFQKRFLQHQQYKLPAKRWALKGVMHQFQLDALFEAFPDALCLWPHRDPAEVYGSTLTITSVVYGAMSGGRIDWQQYAQHMIEGLREAMGQLLSNPIINDPRIRHLRFKEVTADPVGTLRAAYNAWGLSFSDEFETRMRHWLAHNQGDRYGRVHHALEPFGLDAETVRAQFADYRARFGV